MGYKPRRTDCPVDKDEVSITERMSIDLVSSMEKVSTV